MLRRAETKKKTCTLSRILPKIISFFLFCFVFVLNVVPYVNICNKSLFLVIFLFHFLLSSFVFIFIEFLFFFLFYLHTFFLHFLYLTHTERGEQSRLSTDFFDSGSILDESIRSSSWSSKKRWNTNVIRKYIYNRSRLIAPSRIYLVREEEPRVRDILFLRHCRFVSLSSFFAWQ